MSVLKIYTDGGCYPNPGPGGYGAILVFGQHKKEIVGGDPETTNNRMELTACIKALEQLTRRCEATIYSDSKYVVNGCKWAVRWKRNGWKTKEKTPAKNIDLWEKMLYHLEFHKIEVQWIPGHAGHPENERCDELATMGRLSCTK